MKRPRGLLPDSCYGVEILLKTEKKRGNSKLETRNAKSAIWIRLEEFNFRIPQFRISHFALFRISNFEFPFSPFLLEHSHRYTRKSEKLPYAIVTLVCEL